MVWTLRARAHSVKRGIQGTCIGRALNNVQVSGDCPQYLDAIQMHPVSLGGAAQIKVVGEDTLDHHREIQQTNRQ